MDIRTGHGHQGRIHSRCIVIAQTKDSLYKQSVEYCCGSLSSSLVNYTTHVLHQISTLRFIACAAIGHWSSSCHNIIFFLLTKFGLVVKYRKTEVFHFSRSYRAFNPPSLVSQIRYSLVVILELNSVSEVQYKDMMIDR